MIYKYKSPLEMSQQYLMSQGGNFLPEELQAIEKAKSVGAGEDVYIPALALNRMKKEDTELGSMYDDYKKSPTTFFSKFKSQYGEGDKGAVGKVLGFIQNAIVDVGETGEEIYGAVRHPIETLKGVASLGKALDFRDSNKEAKEIRSALGKTITDNFGSWEKAKETFYENPFDVISTLMPVVGAIGKTGKVSKTLSTISKAVDIGAEAGMAGKIAKGGVKTAEYVASKLKDYANIDNYIIGKMAKAPGAVADVAKSAYGSVLLGGGGGKAFKTMLESTKDPARIAAQSKYAAMTPEQVGNLPTEMINKVKQGEEVAMKTAWKEVGEQGPKQIVPNETGAVFNKNMFEDYEFGSAKGNDLISINAKQYGGNPVLVSDDVVKFQEDVNKAFNESGLTKQDLLTGVQPNKLEAFRKKIDEIAANTKGTPQNMANVFAGEIRNIQNRTFPKIAQVRKEFSDVYSKINTLATEIGKSTKDSTIYSRVGKLIDETGLSKETIEFFAKKTGVNLEDVAVALRTKEALGRFGKGTAFAGILGASVTAALTGNPAYLIGILGTSVVGSPLLMYKLAKFTGPKKAAVIGAIAKTTGASTEAVTSMLDKIGKAADASKFTKMVSAGRTMKNLGVKASKKGESYAILNSILERIKNSDEAAGVSDRRDELQGQMQEIGNTQLGEGMQQTTEPMGEQEDINAPYQDQLVEGAEINPDYLQ